MIDNSSKAEAQWNEIRDEGLPTLQPERPETSREKSVQRGFDRQLTLAARATAAVVSAEDAVLALPYKDSKRVVNLAVKLVAKLAKSLVKKRLATRLVAVNRALKAAFLALVPSKVQVATKPRIKPENKAKKDLAEVARSRRRVSLSTPRIKPWLKNLSDSTRTAVTKLSELRARTPNVAGVPTRLALTVAKPMAQVASRLKVGAKASTKNTTVKMAAIRTQLLQALTRRLEEVSLPMKQLQAAVKSVGQRISNAYSDSKEWLEDKADKLAQVGNFLMRPVRAASSLGVGSLIAMTALIPGLIAPFIRGVDKALTDRFGENYIQNFIRGLWSKSWSFLVEQVRAFLGLNKTTDEKKRESANENKTRAERQLKVAEAKNAATPSKYNQARVESAKLGVASANLYNDLANKKDPNTVVSSALDLFTKAPPAKRFGARNDLEVLVRMEIPNGSLSPEIAAKVRKAGVDVPPTKIAPVTRQTPSSSNTPLGAISSPQPIPKSTPAPANVSSSPQPIPKSTPAPANVSSSPQPIPKTSAQSAVGAASAPPMESAAKPPASSARPSMEAQPVKESTKRISRGGVTPGVNQVPTSMGDSALFAINARVLGS